eukprot:TRINITY_DN219_c1_g3_i2.p1 TRINITY_DN219_c1_g3~~TRINITY_DN219_c1_g3_i2.p1  ORF type:complete len:356 (-),score=168.99 TRINITY_DN219_c1_g3_i2:58-1125(-)
MGNCLSGEVTIGTEEERNASRQIDNQIRRDQKNEEIKLLLLGAGETGKTTFLKQMKIINLDGFKEEERNHFVSTIHANIVISMRALLTSAEKSGKITELSPTNKTNAELFTSTATIFSPVLTPPLADAVKALWADPIIREVQITCQEFDFMESAPYFFSKIDEVRHDTYLPSPDDILRARVRTTGITELVFPMKKDQLCRMIDVGGQRSERRKWIHCFQEVTAVLFFVALSEFDLVLQEAQKVNRMHESAKLFEEVCNCRWFANTNVILFFNKRDLFEQKIQKTPLTVCFPDYKGENNFKDTTEFIKKKFGDLNRNPKRNIYMHLTCATDTEAVRKVYNSVRDIFLGEATSAAGF